MSLVDILTIVGAVLTVVGLVVGAVLWIRNGIISAARAGEDAAVKAADAGEQKRKLLHARLDAEVAQLRGELAGAVRAERENADRVYAQRADLAAVQARLEGIEKMSADILQTVHDLRDSMRPSRGDAPDPDPSPVARPPGEDTGGMVRVGPGARREPGPGRACTREGEARVHGLRAARADPLRPLCGGDGDPCEGQAVLGSGAGGRGARESVPSRRAGGNVSAIDHNAPGLWDRAWAE